MAGGLICRWRQKACAVALNFLRTGLSPAKGKIQKRSRKFLENCQLPNEDSSLNDQCRRRAVWQPQETKVLKRLAAGETYRAIAKSLTVHHEWVGAFYCSGSGMFLAFVSGAGS